MPVEPGRHYRGAVPAEMRPGVWTCPSCQQKNTTPLEEGCPGCGAGTEEERERARLAAMEGLPDAAALLPFVIGGTEQQILTSLKEPTGVVFLGLLSTRARLTIARALAHYSEHAASHPGSELTRAQQMGWARVISQALDQEEAAVKHGNEQ